MKSTHKTKIVWLRGVMIHPESKDKNNNFNKKISTNLLIRMLMGWLPKRYSTTTDPKYCGSQLSGNFSVIPPSAIGL